MPNIVILISPLPSLEVISFKDPKFNQKPPFTHREMSLFSLVPSTQIFLVNDYRGKPNSLKI